MNLSRRTFALTGAAALLRADTTAPEPPALLLLTDKEARRIRGSLTSNRLAALDKLAAAALKAGPWSVTSHRPSGLGVTAGEHDYVSEGPYWWPDPANPGGPFIRKDGQRNPDRFMGNRSDLGAMCGATLALGMGAYFLKKPECAERAALIVSTWFIDPKTRMNPNLEFGQMVRGVNTGRGTGIIDTASLIHVAQGMRLAEAAGGMPGAVSSGVRQWFADYLKWMTTSEKGLDEKKATNNHATWWTAQAAAYATFVGDSELRRMAWDRYRNYLVPAQIRPDGSCPREEARTQSLGYSAMNLDAFSIICRLAQMDHINLWHFTTETGIGVAKAFEYLTPYLLHPDQWKKEQISRFNPGGHFFPGLAGVGLPSSELLSAYQKISQPPSAWPQFLDLVIQG
jgi:hypothetical protein